MWQNAPQNGLFALFTMEPTPKATQADREKFAALLGRPLLLLEQPGKEPLADAGEILTCWQRPRRERPPAHPPKNLNWRSV